MIITSHMQKIIQIYTCLLKLSRKQESVTNRQTDGQTDEWRTDSRYYYIPSPLSQGDNKKSYKCTFQYLSHRKLVLK